MKKHKTRRKRRLILASCSSLFCLMVSPAVFAAVSGDELFQRQTQQQDALQQQFDAKAPDVRLQPLVDKTDITKFPVESPCFEIEGVEVSGTEAFPRWVPLQRLADKAQGQCLGVQGINQLMGQLHNRLVLHGWVTARVLAPEQDLTSGTLKLSVIPGKVRQVRFADGADTPIPKRNAMNCSMNQMRIK